MASNEKSSKLPEPNGRWIAVIRVRGTVNVRRDIEDTLKLLRLHKPNHCVVLRYTPSLKGMLMKAQHKIAWGEIDFDIFCKLLKERGYLVGNKKISDNLVREYSNGKFSTIEELAMALWSGEIKFKDVPWLKPVFRLHPPKRGGYKRSVKKLYGEGGALGYWGRNIKTLLSRMI